MDTDVGLEDKWLLQGHITRKPGPSDVWRSVSSTQILAGGCCTVCPLETRGGQPCALKANTLFWHINVKGTVCTIWEKQMRIYVYLAYADRHDLFRVLFLASEIPVRLLALSPRIQGKRQAPHSGMCSPPCSWNVDLFLGSLGGCCLSSASGRGVGRQSSENRVSWWMKYISSLDALWLSTRPMRTEAHPCTRGVKCLPFPGSEFNVRTCSQVTLSE